MCTKIESHRGVAATPLHPSQPTALYRFYDQQGELLYVGITLDPGTRWQAHAREKGWWRQVATVTVTWLDDRAAALEAERVAILAEAPRHNIAQAGTRCPACLRPATYDRELDRHHHQDTSIADEPCWLALLRNPELR